MNNTDIKFRKAAPKDMPILLELEQRVVTAERPFNETIRPGSPRYYDLDQLIEDKQSLLLVAENEGTIITTGYAQIRESKASLRHQQHSYLGFMYVDPDYRGQGLIAMVLQRLIDWSQSQQIYDLYLDVYYQNSAAVRAYEKAGFEKSVVEMKLHLDQEE